MKKVLLAGAALAALFTVSAASAADIPARPYYKAPPAPVFNWTGFYIGVHGGYAWGDADLNGVSAEPEGAFGGVQLGYNWQFSPNWVFGIETDIAFSDINDSVAGNNTDLRYFGTVRARVGYAWDRSLLYVTGGFAYGNNEISTGAGSDDQTHFGYAVGAGYEWAFARGWSAKIEYLYVDLDSETYNVGGVVGNASLDFSTIKLGVNYRF